MRAAYRGDMKALIVVDVQKGFLKPQVAHLPEKIAKHIEGTKYDAVLFTKYINHHGSNFEQWLGWKKVYGPPDTELADELIPYARKNTVFTKSTYSAFKSARLRTYLRRRGITRIAICGLEADGCVLASAYEAFDLGFEVEVLRALMRSTTTLNRATENVIQRNIDRQVKRRS